MVRVFELNCLGEIAAATTLASQQTQAGLQLGPQRVGRPRAGPQRVGVDGLETSAGIGNTVRLWSPIPEAGIAFGSVDMQSFDSTSSNL